MTYNILLLKSDNSVLKIFFFLHSPISGWIGNTEDRHFSSKMSGTHMEKSEYNFPSGEFMIMSVDNLVNMRYQGGFYTGFSCYGHQNGLSNGILGLCIPIIWMEIMIWYKVLLKLRVSFGVLLRRRKVLSVSSQRT